MNQLSPRPQVASRRVHGANSWALSMPGDEENAAKTESHAERAFRILIVDRDTMSSDLLASALARDRHFNTSAISSCDLLHALAAGQVDLVVIGSDLNHSSKSGCDLAQDVARAHPGIMIVILLNRSTHDSVINAFRSGAHGVFSRDQSMAEFLDCVEHVSKGAIWAGRKETTFVLDAFKSIPSPNLALASVQRLTERELQVVHCAAKGKTNKVIASDLGLSEHTVKNYLFRAFEKLGVSNRVELLFYLTLKGQRAGAEDEEPQPDRSYPDRLAAL
jgi:two-component system nitrate/nitrite response regulator NarL